MKPLERLRTMGPAVWLFLLYQNNAEYADDPVWVPVGEGCAVTDVHVASVLKISASTAVRWRRRLERVSVIKTQACRGGGFKIWLRHSDAESTESGVLTPERWPEMQSTTVQ
jgi:hypothetical protein